jgi:UPF0755 protein
MTGKIANLIGVAAFSFFLLFNFLQFPEEPVLIQKLQIAPGMGFNEIAAELKSEKLIGSKTIFRIYNLITGQINRLKPGTYLLPTDISLIDLTKTLVSGPAEISVVIVPGMTIREIDEKLSNLSVIEPNALLNLKVDSLKNSYPWLKPAESLEGFILPDSYHFFLGSEAGTVVRKFLDNFELKALPFFENNSNLLKTLNLASLLEKEIPDYEEREIAAGILLKRLAVGMPLQIDATIVYVKCGGKFSNCPALKEEDYKINSTYNTYRYGGLPPGPICNPDLSAIKAALHPQKSDYWYYLSDPKTKKTIFAKNLDEHNQNRVKYLLNN